jgi:hypothetical protein
MLRSCTEKYVGPVLNICASGSRTYVQERHWSASQAQHQMQSGFLLNVVVSQCAAVLQLLPREYEALLIGWDALLILYFLLQVLDSVRAFNVQCDGLPCQSLDENLHVAHGFVEENRIFFLKLEYEGRRVGID